MQHPHPPTASVVDHLKRWPALAGALAWVRGQGALIRQGGRAGMARLLAWLSPVLLVLVGQVMAGGGVVNDAYSYIDDFNDNNGIDAAASSGYSNIGGSLQANAGTMSVQSPCFSLPQPSGGVFNNWLFLEIGTSQLGNTTGNTLTVQSCGAGTQAAGTLLASQANVAAGTVGLALNGIAGTETSIRLNWTVNHSVSPALGGTPARLDFWRVFGKSTGPTVVNVVPLTTAIQPSQSSVFRITFNSNGAVTRNAVLRLPMFDINGLSATGTAQAPAGGLASDAQKDYGNGAGLRVNRPVSVTAYSTAPDGSSATSTLVANATAGQLSWNLGDLPSGYSGSVTVTITVPSGTLSPSTVAARAYVDHGATPVAAITGVTPGMTVSGTSSNVTVTSPGTTWGISNYTPFSRVGPGQAGVYSSGFPYNLASGTTTAADAENVTYTVNLNAGTCTPTYKGFTWGASAYTPPTGTWRVLSQPTLDTPATTPLVIQMDRLAYNAWTNSAQAFIQPKVDVPASCAAGTNVKWTFTAVIGNPSRTATGSLNLPVVVNYCRGASNYYMMRTTDGPVPKYTPWPGWTAYYIMGNGSAHAGEWIAQWLYGNEGNAAQTVTLDHSYYVATVPAWGTFHGLSSGGNTSRMYKDSTGTAPLPTDAGFDHAANPPHAAWKPVSTTVIGSTPFSAAPNDNNPSAVVLPGTRLLVVRDVDAPLGVAPNYGGFVPAFMFRVADGSYGVTEAADGTALMSTALAGRVYTYETVSNSAGASHDCGAISNSTGYKLTKELVSWPVLKTAATTSVAAGGSTVVNVYAGNTAMASAPVSGFWGVNFFATRNDVDLANISASVVTSGAIVPPGGNAAGISFTPINAAACRAAVSSTDPACFAYFTVPANTQPAPAYLALRNLADTNENVSKQYPPFKLTVPILRNVPAGKVLSFNAELRKSDLTTLGADNPVATTRWAASNYVAAATTTVLESPSVTATLSAPANWPLGGSYSYQWTTTNGGNTLNNGFYSVLRMPRQGVSGAQLTPTYGKTYLSLTAADVLLESSVDANCFNSTLTAAWTSVPLQATARAGFASESAAAINASALCLRVRRNSSGATFAAGAVLSAAVDVSIPNLPANDGLFIGARALAGSSTTLGSTLDASPVETADAMTQVSSVVVTGGAKTFAVDPTRAGWMRWTLRYANKSGVAASNVAVTDILPAELIYQGLAAPLPAGVSCAPADCSVVAPNGDGTGGQLRLTVASLSPNDGAAGSGSDEGSVDIWAKFKPGVADGTVSSNCLTTSPGSTGIGSNGCTPITSAKLTASLVQTVVPAQGGSPPWVFPNDVLRYTLTLTNTDTVARYMRVADVLPSDTTLLAGSFRVNGVAAPETVFTAGVLSYTSAASVAPGTSMTLQFDAQVKGTAANNVDIFENMVVTPCTDAVDLGTCMAGKTTNTVQARVKAIAAITGTVYEDANYGGGAGRSLAASGGVARPNVRVELYDGTGAFFLATTTNASGVYSFTDLGPATYTVRVVNSTVLSARTGAVAALWPVQTWHVDASSGTVVADPNAVGGQNPQAQDAAANTSSATLASLTAGNLTPQSIALVKASTGTISGVDFGFNFSTIVNTNDSGQGSLRQWMTNANTLGGKAALAQSGYRRAINGATAPLPGGVETTVFMVPGGAAVPGLRAALPSQLSSGVALIQPASALPAITQALVSIDGTTQTANVSDSNAGALGAGGTVGASAAALAQVKRPEVQLVGNSALVHGLWLSGSDSSVRGLAVRGFGNTSATTSADVRLGGANALAEGNVIGTDAGGFADPGAAARSGGSGLVLEGNNAVAQGNLIGWVGNAGVIVNAGTGTLLADNEIRETGQASGVCCAQGIAMLAGSGATVLRNLVVNAGTAGIELASTAHVVAYNTVTGSGMAGAASTGGAVAGVWARGTGSMVQLNLVAGNRGAGVLVTGSVKATISMNAITNNGSAANRAGTPAVGALGIDLAGDGVSANDGAKPSASPNAGMDFPVVQAAAINGNQLYIRGYVGSASGQTLFAGAVLQLFKSDADASGYGEGATYLGTVTADSSGRFDTSFTLATGTTVVAGDNITATATDASGNTSEFGPNVVAAALLTGTVFEDVHYGGGAGRSLGASGGVGLAGAVVEAYDEAGAFVMSGTTDASGTYRLWAPPNARYLVRVVNASVKSSRLGASLSLPGVLTFRTEASTGSAVAVTDQVGGLFPASNDGPAGATGSSLWTTCAQEHGVCSVTGSALVRYGGHANGVVGWAYRVATGSINCDNTVFGDPALGVLKACQVMAATSLTNVSMGTAGMGNLDFGFNFDTVVNTNDAGAGSLRQAILNANSLGNDNLLAQVGRTAGIENLIFMLADGTARAGLSATLPSQFSGGVARIALQTALTAVNDTLVMDAQTQPGWALAPRVEIDAGALSGADSLVINRDNCIVRGFVFSNVVRSALVFSGTVGGVAQGNYIGTNATGLAASALPSAVGVVLTGSDHLIGGTLPSQRNVIGGVLMAIQINPTGTRDVIQGNYIGVGADGRTPIPTGNWAVYVGGLGGTVVGGSAPGAGNVVSAGNVNGGIYVNSPDTVVQGNFIGTDSTGSIALPNPGRGVLVNSLGLRALIGGATAAAGNVISGNTGTGLLISAPNAQVLNNTIGYNAARTAALPNGAGGISLSGASAASSTIGLPGQGNFIAGNTGAGVSLAMGGAGEGNAIRFNRIFGNSGLGIDLKSDGVSVNDGARAVGENQMIDQPVFTGTVITGTGATTKLFVSGYVGSAPGQTTFGNVSVDVYTSDGDASGYGEGALWLGTVVTDASGNFRATIDLSTNPITPGTRLTAAATDAAGNTSEFGAIATANAGVGGTVFEDVNYGGGAARTWATAQAGGGRPVAGATVEVYAQGTGAFVSRTTTDASGSYLLPTPAAGFYNVRVVSGSVVSSRTASGTGLVPVLTLRSSSTGGTTVAITDQVGGPTPGAADVPANVSGANWSTLQVSASAKPTAWASVEAPSSQLSVGSVDFGFNFNTVVNTNDSGQGSLRQAITNANTLNGDSALAQVGRTAGIEHLIFMLADGTARAGLSSALPSQFSGGVASVALQSALPSVTAPLVLDAQTQPGWALAPLIELNGASAGTGATGLNLASGSSGSILRGFVVNRMSGDGVATSANNLTIQGNYLGTNASGSAAAANAVGLRLGAGGPLQVGGTTASQRNLISGNTGNGVHLDLYASSVVIEGNYIGLDANGSSAVANAGNGIYSSANYQGLRIGSAAAGGGNVISGNTGWGINLNQTDNPQVLGNRVGTNAAGTAAVRNGGGLYLIGVINGRIGGSAAGEGNLISGNASHGISDAGYGSGTRVIAGNVIGLGAVAGSVIGNLRSGIVSAQAGTLIGGSTAAAGNVISGNADNGVWLVNTSGAAISLLNNTIGMDAAGLLARPNAVGVKIQSQWGAVNGNVIGAPGQGNLIAGNTGAGVQLPSGAGDNNSIRGNRMRGNGGLGIDLANSGVSINDGAKGSGSNKLMDYPVFTTANVRGDQLTVKGYVGSAAGQTLFAGALVDVYVSDNDSSGYGEGDLPLGTVVADANGNFSATLTLATGAVNTSSRITGTATDGSGSTSEFGPNFKLVVEWVINDNGDAVDANPGDGKCETAVAGKCTLRAAIMESNATPGMAAVFGLPNCPGAGCKISPTSALPAITSQLRIDGSTQPGFAGTPLVWLDGSGAGNVDGLVFSGAGAAGSSLRGLSVTGYAGSNGRAISLSAVSNVSLQGNFIGLLPDGVTTGANRVGVEVIGGSALLIGGVVAADGNRFAANTYGVALTGTGQRVVGNTFGLGGDGVSLVTPNLWAVPVWGGTDHQIGGTGPGEANAIVRGQRGVWLAGGLRNRVSGNSIRGQSGLGIDILGDGVTVNDGAVSAAKPNNGMDYPVLTLAAYNPATGRLTVQGYVGTAPGQTVFGGAQVELFKSDGNPSGYGSGAVYLGTVSTDANGRFDTAIVISSSLLALGDGLTATATDAVGNTSEFSGSFTVTDEALLKPARFNAFETDTPAGSITGVIRTKVAGAAATLSVIATNSAGTALHAGFTGNVALEWLDARNDSAAADAGACRASWLSLGSAGAVAFNNNARNDVSLTPPAGSTRSMRLRMTYAANGVTTVACSTDAFAVVPASLVIDGAFDTDAVSSGITRRLDNASASGGVVHNAGQPFTVQARALTASGAVMTGYDGTPDLVLATCELPSGCSGGTLTAPATAAAAGVYSNSSVRYAEVGVITLRLQDLSYAAVDVADTPAASRELRSVRVAAGRFVPDNYLLSVSTTGQLHTANASCTLAGAGYSFIGQGFGWATPTTVQVTARNATGGTTTLWTGSLMKLLPAHATGAMTASATGTATLSASYGALAVADLGSGQARITASNADQYTLQAAAAQASVSPLFSWALQLTDTSEAGVAGNPTPTGHVTDAPIGFDLGGVFHSGRLALAGGHGDARQGVRMLVQLQRFTTTGWQTLNEDRGCVTVSPLNLGYSEPVGVFGAAGLCAAPVTSPSTTAGGRAWLGLPATPGGQTGQLTVRLLTGAGAANSCAAANSPAAGQSLGLAHLLGGQAAPGPTAHATWGLTNRDLLYRRERY